MGIGILAGLVFIYEPKWPPSGLLQSQSDITFGNDSQLLFTLPSLSPAGALVVLGIVLGIYLDLLLRDKYKLSTA